MYQHDAGNTGYSQESFPNNFTQLWYKSYEDDLNIDMISMFASPVSSNGKIFIPGDDNDNNSVICALDEKNGGLIWKKEIPINNKAITGLHGFRSPVVYEGKIFTIIGCFITSLSRNKIVALDENTGDIIWEKPFFGISWYSSVTVEDGKVFVCGHMTFVPISWLYVFDADNGDLLWRKTFRGYIETTPVVYEEKVIVAPGRVSGLSLTSSMIFPLFSGFSRAHALDIDTGEQIWVKKINGHLVHCSPTASNGILFVPSNIMILKYFLIDRLSALDLDTGEEIWHNDFIIRFRDASWPTSISTPSVGYGKVFMTDSSGWLHVWDQVSGDLVWEKEIYPNNPNASSTVVASPVIVDGKVIVGGNAMGGVGYNQLIMFNESTGDLIRIVGFKYESTSPFIVSNDMLFVNSGWDGIYAFG
jgi:outer membrane protein assembly factor BamB